MKIFLTALSLLISVSIYALPNRTITDTNSLGIIIPAQTTNLAQKNKKFIQDFFIWLDGVSNHKIKLTKKDMRMYFDDHVIYSVNGKTLAFDAAHLQARLQKLVNMYKRIDVIFPAKIIIIAGNHVAVHYRLKLENKNDQQYTDDIVTLITLKKQKITAWQAVIAHSEH